MSTWITEYRFGEYIGQKHSGAFAVVGRTLLGNEEYGKVRAFTTINGFWGSLTTEKPCRQESHDHDLLQDDATTRCRECSLVLKAEPIADYRYGFFTGDFGVLSCDVAPYDVQRHGPFGALTLELAMEQAQIHLAEWKSWFGDAPYYIVEHEEPDAGSVVDIIAKNELTVDLDNTEDNGLINAYAGPFDTLNEAVRVRYTYVCANRRYIDYTFQKMGWKVMTHKGWAPYGTPYGGTQEQVPSTDEIPF